MMAIVASTEAIMPNMRVPRASDTGPEDSVDGGVMLPEIEMLECDSKERVRLETNGAIAVKVDGKEFYWSW